MTAQREHLNGHNLQMGVRALVFDADAWAAFEKSVQAQDKSAQQLSNAVAASLGTVMMDSKCVP